MGLGGGRSIQLSYTRVSCTSHSVTDVYLAPRCLLLGVTRPHFAPPVQRPCNGSAVHRYAASGPGAAVGGVQISVRGRHVRVADLVADVQQAPSPSEQPRIVLLAQVMKPQIGDVGLANHRAPCFLWARGPLAAFVSEDDRRWYGGCLLVEPSLAGSRSGPMGPPSIQIVMPSKVLSYVLPLFPFLRTPDWVHQANPSLRCRTLRYQSPRWSCAWG
jgi:hypothetical protein